MLPARLAPVPDSVRFAPSGGVLRLALLRSRFDFLMTCPLPRQVAFLYREYGPVHPDVMLWQVFQQLREQGGYLIQVGVR